MLLLLLSFHTYTITQSQDKAPSKAAATVNKILFAFTYPRLDMEVSKKMNHLLKAPFCVHPKTGKVCVPIRVSDAEAFNPEQVITVQQLLGELSNTVTKVLCWLFPCAVNLVVHECCHVLGAMLQNVTLMHNESTRKNYTQIPYTIVCAMLSAYTHCCSFCTTTMHCQTSRVLPIHNPTATRALAVNAHGRGG